MLHTVSPLEQWGVKELVFFGDDGVGDLSRVRKTDFLVPAFFSYCLLAAEGIEAIDIDGEVGQGDGERRVAHVLRDVA